MRDRDKNIKELSFSNFFHIYFITTSKLNLKLLSQKNYCQMITVNPQCAIESNIRILN